MAPRTLRDFVVSGPPRRSSAGTSAPATSPVDRGWARHVEAFLAWKRADTPVGEEWIRRMRWELLRFPSLLARLGDPGPSTDPTSIHAGSIERLRAGLEWEKATFQLHFAAVRQFLAWAGNPIAARRSVWSLPSGESTHRRWLTKAQLVRLYRGSVGLSRLLVALEGFNGLRRIEVLRLRVKDVDLGEGCLRVLGKGRNGGKWRRIPVYPSVRSVLERAASGRRPSDRLVPRSRSGADLLLARAARDAGLAREGVPVSHHDLRRTFGRLAHAAGMDLVQLKNLYGHASLEMTVHYIGLDADTMRAGLERLSVSIGRLD